MLTEMLTEMLTAILHWLHMYWILVLTIWSALGVVGFVWFVTSGFAKRTGHAVVWLAILLAGPIIWLAVFSIGVREINCGGRIRLR